MTSISVVVPVLDDADALATCLRALAAQTRPPDELIVVDNGSRDGSAAVARAAGATVLSEPVHGIWPAAARGYDAARGDLIARCDSDTVLPPHWLARVERLLAEHQDAVAVTGPGRFPELGPLGARLAGLLYMRPYFLLTRLGLGNRAVFGSNFAIRSQVWRNVRASAHLDDPEVHDDLDLSFALPPEADVLHDIGLAADVSAAPLRDPRGLARRVRRAAHTFRRAGPMNLPWIRWSRRVRRRRAARAVLR